jgi:hypothetical protein
MPTLLETAFSEVDLTASINDLALPNEPAIDRLVPFNEAGIETTEGIVERQGETVAFLPTAPRGGVAQAHQSGQRDGVRVATVHIPTRATVLADQAQDQRAHGKTTTESPQALRERTLLAMKKNIVYTQAMHKLGTIKGLVLDADGSTLLDVFALFGVAQQVQNMALDVAGTNVLIKTIDAQRKAEDALGGATPTDYVALASPSFMDALRAHGYYEKVLQYAAPSELMADFRTGIVAGGTTYVELRAAGPVAIEDNTAYLVPRGIEDLLIARYAPADYNSTVNTVGLPLYAVAEEMPLGKGFILESQSNPFHLCTRPRSIIKLTASA